MISHLFSHLSQFVDMHFCVTDSASLTLRHWLYVNDSASPRHWLCVTDSASLTLRHWLCVADSASLTLRHWRVAEFVTFLLGIRRRMRIRRLLRHWRVADSRRSRTAPYAAHSFENYSTTVIIWIMSRDIIFWKFPKVGHYSRAKFLTFDWRQSNHLWRNLTLS